MIAQDWSTIEYGVVFEILFSLMDMWNIQIPVLELDTLQACTIVKCYRFKVAIGQIITPANQRVIEILQP